MQKENSFKGVLEGNKKAVNKKSVILNLIQDLPRLPFLKGNNPRGRFPIETLGNDSILYNDDNNNAFAPLSSSRSVLVRDIKGVLKNFAAPIPRIETLRGDGARRGGFTLIELLVVVLIIGILASVALPQYKLAVAKARVNRLLPIMKSIENAQLVYKMANGEYANDFTLLDIDMPAGGQISNSNKQVDYTDFTCFLGNTSTTKNSLYCQDKHYAFSLERYYLSHTFCWFTKTDDTAKKLCGYLCQTSSFGSDSTGNSGVCSF